MCHIYIFSDKVLLPITITSLMVDGRYINNINSKLAKITKILKKKH